MSKISYDNNQPDNAAKVVFKPNEARDIGQRLCDLGRSHVFLSAALTLAYLKCKMDYYEIQTHWAGISYSL